jgi:CheY-like chemotaxis protein
MARIAHVVHVDDNEEDRRLFDRAFRHSRMPAILHSMASASSVLLFLNRYGKYALMPRPRLVIMDLSLPRLDGRELLEIMHADFRFSSIPVVVLTGSDSEADRMRCRAVGVVDYLVKPHQYAELATLVAGMEHFIVGSSNRRPVDV